MESVAKSSLNLAEVVELMKSGRPGEAIVALESIVTESPTNAQAYSCLGAAYTQTGKKQYAVAAFEKSLEIAKSARSHYNLGLAYQTIDRNDEAVAQFRQALLLDANYAPAQQALLKLSQISSEPEAAADAAVGDATVAIPAAPENPTSPPATEQTVLDVVPDFSAIGDKPKTPEDFAAEAEEKALRAEEQRKHYIKSGVIYGAICGAIFLLLARFSLAIFLPMFIIGSSGSILSGAIFTFLLGGIMGALIGLWIGLTCGGDTEGLQAGAAIGAVLGLILGIVNGAGFATIIVMVLCALICGVFGFIIGKMVESSIGY